MFKLTVWFQIICLLIVAHNEMFRQKNVEPLASNDSEVNFSAEEDWYNDEDDKEYSATTFINEIDDDKPTHRNSTKNKHTFSENEKITGGKRTLITDMPFLAILRVYKDAGPIFCTSSILNEEWVLSAAHCIGRVTDPSKVEIIAGQSHIIVREIHAQIRQASRVVVHPGYFQATSPGNGDIALIKVAAPFNFNDYVSYIKLSSEEWPQPSQKLNCISAGWGREKFNDRKVGPLQAFKSVATHGSDYCPCTTTEQKRRIICLEKSAGQGICKGDSGGPLVCNDQLIGVAHVLFPAPFLCMSVFAGRPECGVAGWIDVYMYTCPYLDWIRDYVGNTVPPSPASCSGTRFYNLDLRWKIIIAFIISYAFLVNVLL